MTDDKITMNEARLEDDLELARKLAAACLAHHLGHKSIDYTRKRYVDSDEIGTGWIELAQLVKQRLETMLQGVGGIPMATTRLQ